MASTERRESYGRERAVEMLMDMHKDGPAIRVAKIMVSSLENTCCELHADSNGSYKDIILRLFPETGKEIVDQELEEQWSWNLCLYCVLYCIVLYRSPVTPRKGTTRLPCPRTNLFAN